MPKTTSYVALLRGINVGGKNVIAMKDLTATFERMGMSAVKTYIQSGNVLFQCASGDIRAVEKRIEAALKKAHGYDAKVVLRSKDQMVATVAGLPRAWRRVDPGTRYYVLFLRHEIDDPAIVEELAPKAGVEQVWYEPGVLYWSARFRDLSRSSMAKLTSKAVYKQMTVRNLNTTKKLVELLGAY